MNIQYFRIYLVVGVVEILVLTEEPVYRLIDLLLLIDGFLLSWGSDQVFEFQILLVGVGVLLQR